MRWARGDDVKKKGAKKQSGFYKKYGETAGKEIGGVKGPGPLKKRRKGDDSDRLISAQQLDDDLDAFLAEEEEEVEVPASPPSKMYSDYISNDGRTLLERTSVIRAHPIDLASRLRTSTTTSTNKRKRREKELARIPYQDSRAKSKDASSENSGRGRRGERPKKSQQDLDDELEAFLNEKD